MQGLSRRKLLQVVSTTALSVSFPRAVLPETGVTYYDVPESYGPTPYRYTVVNGATVLVEPRTRRVVQIVE